MAQPTLKDRKDLVQQWILSVLAYTDKITWFGANSVAFAIGMATAGLVEGAYLLYVALLRRLTVMASSGTELSQVAAERGTPRNPATRAKVFLIVQPESDDVMSISLGTGPVGGGDEIEIADATVYQAGDSIRIRNGDGTTTETQTIAGITTGTGPGGGDEIEVGTLVNAYTPASDDVDILFRATIAAGTTVETSAGVDFETLAQVTTGDANPVLDGEGTHLGLADKVWAEATVRGESGNIEALSVTDFASAVRGVVQVWNPERATGGAEEESDFDLKYRAINRPTTASQETWSWMQELAKMGNTDVLRLINTDTTALRTLAAKVISASGGPLSSTELANLETYLEDRVRSQMEVSLSNISLTSIEVEGFVGLDNDTTLEEAWRAAAGRLVAFLDWRKWEFGGDVDDADLYKLVVNTPGIASLDASTFSPSATVTVGDESLPTLARLSLTDGVDTINATLAVSF